MYLQLLDKNEDRQCPIKNCQKPKMGSGHFGRTWGVLTNFILEGKRVEVLAETT